MSIFGLETIYTESERNRINFIFYRSVGREKKKKFQFLFIISYYLETNVIIKKIITKKRYFNIMIIIIIPTKFEYEYKKTVKFYFRFY